MKLFSFLLRSGRCRAGVLALCAGLLHGAAPAQNAQLDTAAQQLEADVRALAQARRDQWVELPTGWWRSRHFVAELARREADNAVLVRRRIDYWSAGSDGAASVVHTVWLYCDAGQMRIVAEQGYDLQGRQVFSTETPDAPATAVEGIYSGPEQLICSQQYLLLDVADGYQRLAELLRMRRALRAAAMPDRPIPTQ